MMADISRKKIKLIKKIGVPVFFVYFTAFLFTVAFAQHLPIKNYTVADGLAHNRVNNIIQDQKGFLWLATWEGLSRFDGYDFTNYSREDGLGHDFVNDLKIDKQGHLWIATNGGGVARLLDEPNEQIISAEKRSRRKFASFLIEANYSGSQLNLANNVNRILFDDENRMWCVTDAGLFRARHLEVADKDFDLVVVGSNPLPFINEAAFADSHGRLWFGMKEKLVLIADGQTQVFVMSKGVADEYDEISEIAEDQNGRILILCVGSFFEVDPTTQTRREIPIKREKKQYLQRLLITGERDFWIGSNTGLIHLHDGQQTTLTQENGLINNSITSLYLDHENNLWFGTSLGLSKFTGISSAGITSVNYPINNLGTIGLFSDHNGQVVYYHCQRKVVEVIDENFNPSKGEPNADGKPCGLYLYLHDSFDRWWFFYEDSFKISESSDLDLTKGQVLSLPDGEKIKVSDVYEDSTGTVWLSATNRNLYRAKNTPDKIPRFELVANNIGAFKMLRDSGGTLWLTDREILWRMHPDGKFERITQIENLSTIQARCFFEDSHGRFWIGTRSDGVIYTDNPQAETDKLNFKRLTVEDGLVSNTVWRIIEDDSGAIYFGTGRGVNRLDANGKISHLTIDNGVIGSTTGQLLNDHKGNIWIVTDGGITRITPANLRDNSLPPPVFISNVSIAGEELPLAETGVTEFSAPELSSDKNNIEIRYVGLSFKNEHGLHYEYRLVGTDENWTQAGERREVAYANLAAGKYRFEVRAVNNAGVMSENPAVFEFQIAAPIYRQWWFITLACVMFGSLFYGLYRYRLHQLLEIERTRTRIASDLHDDIGSNLSKISLLSEVVNLQLAQQNTANSPNNPLLDSIAEISRESVSSMSDIVWAINPKRDSMLELVRRMRLHVEESFLSQDVKITFTAPENLRNFRLSMDVRRELFLIYKEAINNAVKHSDCRNVSIVFQLLPKQILLEIADDGKGFDVSPEKEGNGLANMRKRTEKYQGSCRIESAIGSGTTLTIIFPHK